MPHPSDRRFLVLHALRLQGAAGADVVAERSGVPVPVVGALLDELASAGWVEHRSRGALTGWTLRPPGRAAHARLAQEELAASAAGPVVRAAYERFRQVNPDVLGAVSRWQVHDVGGRPVRNQHGDAGYDARVLADLAAAHRRARPSWDHLAAALARFTPYGPELDHALGRALAGDGDHVARPGIRSYHTVWFELHEDLLSTLGLDRVAEAAS